MTERSTEDLERELLYGTTFPTAGSVRSLISEVVSLRRQVEQLTRGGTAEQFTAVSPKSRKLPHRTYDSLAECVNTANVPLTGKVWKRSVSYGPWQEVSAR